MTENIRKIVRVAGADIDGTLSTVRALRNIRGINWMTSKAICISSGIDPMQKLGSLDEEATKKLGDMIKNQAKEPTLPKWMLNRRKDMETGEDLHLVGADLEFREKYDINFQRRIRSRIGIRHELGLPVRGQHTKSTGRKQKAVGVSKKKAAQKAAPPKAAPAAAKPAPAKGKK